MPYEKDYLVVDVASHPPVPKVPTAIIVSVQSPRGEMTVHTELCDRGAAAGPRAHLFARTLAHIIGAELGDGTPHFAKDLAEALLGPDGEVVADLAKNDNGVTRVRAAIDNLCRLMDELENASKEVVAGADLLGSKGLQLNATHYIDPTRHVDRAIAQAETTIKNTKKRLRTLRAKRKAIIRENMGTP